MSPYSALLATRSQGGVFVEERDGRSAERDVVVSITAVGIDGREIPDGDGQLGVDGNCAVVEGERNPLIPYARALEMLVGGLRVDGERFGVGERLDGDVEFGMWTQITATVAQIGASKESGIGHWSFMAFESVAIDLLDAYDGTGLRSNERVVVGTV